MSKDIQLNAGLKLKEHYGCEIITSDQEPYCLFNLVHIGKILQISNIRSTSIHYDKVYVRCETNGGAQSKSFISYNVFCQILAKSRKPSAVDVGKLINFDVYSKIYSCVEADTLKCIIDAFQGEEIVMQYPIGSYKLDLYFPVYNN